MGNKSKTAFIILILSAVLAAYLPGRGLAASGSIYLSPSGTSVQVDNSISLYLRISPGTAVNAVQATVNYDSSKLEFISSSPSAFPTCPQNSGGGGVVTISCAILGGSVTSDSLISAISFKALAGSGSTSLSLSGANAAYNGSWTNPASAGASVSFSSPAPTPSNPTPTPTHQISSSTQTKTTQPGSTVAPANPTPQPAIIKASASPASVQFTAVYIKISLSAPAKVYIEYGTDKNNLNLQTAPVSLVKSGTISFDPSKLTPGTTYFYRVVTEGSDGNLTKGQIQSLATKGFMLRVKVLDSNYQPLANQTVTLHSTPMNAKTDKQGIAVFNNVAPGPHHIEYASAGGKIYSGSLYVANDFKSDGGIQSAPAQATAAVIAGYQLPPEPARPWLIIILVAIAGVLLSVIAHDFDNLAPKVAGWGQLGSIKLKAEAELAVLRLANWRKKDSKPAPNSPKTKTSKAGSARV
ncbi:MAG TPA: cohesin domain-containing protein [Candidatus Saccharimonadales bacterium]|nr:cohesin domain-containing protein [Candidatus Saccharimonadales bacterium]